jgi:putative ABC transport system ATP-binding protein
MVIIVKDLNKIFSIGSTEIHAIRGLNLTVKEGEMIALVGPSGSGKTTLLNIIGGLDKASSGSITEGKPWGTYSRPSTSSPHSPQPRT